MLKIVGRNGGDGSPVLQLEGAVVGAWVEELARACEPILACAGRLTLDLDGVSFVSREGVGLLTDLSRRRVQLTNCSRFVAEQIKAGSGCS